MILFVLLMLYTITSTFRQLCLIYILLFNLCQTRSLRKVIIHVAFLLLLMFLGKETLALIMCTKPRSENKACDRNDGCMQDRLGSPRCDLEKELVKFPSGELCIC
jgi:hypothetical protein